MISSIDRSSEFNEKDAHGIIKLIEQMGHTITNTSEIEIELGVKTRPHEKKMLEAAAVKRNTKCFTKRQFSMKMS